MILKMDLSFRVGGYDENMKGSQLVNSRCGVWYKSLRTKMDVEWSGHHASNEHDKVLHNPNLRDNKRQTFHKHPTSILSFGFSYMVVLNIRGRCLLVNQFHTVSNHANYKHCKGPILPRPIKSEHPTQCRISETSCIWISSKRWFTSSHKSFWLGENPRATCTKCAWI